MADMTLTNVLMIAAIFFGPIIAVQLTRYLDDRRETRNRRLQIYRILMATRAANLSVGHIEALNSIDLEFSRHGSKDKAVRDAWKAYLDLLGDRNLLVDQWNVRRVDLLVELLSKIGDNVGYSFDKVHIKNSIYSPRAHGEIENDQTEIRRGIREVLEGKRAVSMYVTNLPQSNVSLDKAPGMPPEQSK